MTSSARNCGLSKKREVRREQALATAERSADHILAAARRLWPNARIIFSTNSHQPVCPGPSSPRSPVSACSLVSSLLLVRATMSQDSSLTQSGHSIDRRQHVLDRISGVRKGGFLAHRSQSRSEDETEIRDGKDALRTNHQRHSAGDAEALFG